MSTYFKFRMAQAFLPKSRDVLTGNWDLARMNPKYTCLCVCLVINMSGKMLY
jgi:hypothetical protein